MEDLWGQLQSRFWNIPCTNTRVFRLAVALGCNADFQRPLVITDQQDMVALMQRNITLNNLSSTVEAAKYDWGEPSPRTIPAHPDIILAADCVYFEPAFPFLQKTLLELIGADTICYFCYKKRRRADLQFIKAIKKLFEVKEVLGGPDKEASFRQNIFLCVDVQPNGWSFTNEYTDSRYGSGSLEVVLPTTCQKRAGIQLL